jgi:hypothetical protein
MAAITDGAMTGGVTTITTAITIIIIMTDATLAVDDGLAPVAHCNIRGRSAGLEYHRSIAGTDHGEAWLCCTEACGGAPTAKLFYYATRMKLARPSSFIRFRDLTPIATSVTRRASWRDLNASPMTRL